MNGFRQCSRQTTICFRTFGVIFLISKNSRITLKKRNKIYRKTPSMQELKLPKAAILVWYKKSNQFTCDTISKWITHNTRLFPAPKVSATNGPWIFWAMNRPRWARSWKNWNFSSLDSYQGTQKTKSAPEANFESIRSRARAFQRSPHFHLQQSDRRTN